MILLDFQYLYGLKSDLKQFALPFRLSVPTYYEIGRIFII